MKIGVISDTHDKLPAIDRALGFFMQKNVSLVIHCGDWKSLTTVQYFAEQAAHYELPVKGVLGNNDRDVVSFLAYAATAPGEFILQEGVLELNVDTKKIVAYHGHHIPTLRTVRNREDYDMLCLGHTHKPNIEHIDRRMIINPGSTAFSIPRSKNWQSTVAVIDTATDSATLYEI